MQPKRYARTPTASEKEELEKGYREGKKQHFRIRCHAILLSQSGYSIQYISNLYQKKASTIREWFDWWESEGVKGLQISAGRGRKALLKQVASIMEDIKKKSKNSPLNYKVWQND